VYEEYCRQQKKSKEEMADVYEERFLDVIDEAYETFPLEEDPMVHTLTAIVELLEHGEPIAGFDLNTFLGTQYAWERFGCMTPEEIQDMEVYMINQSSDDKLPRGVVLTGLYKKKDRYGNSYLMGMLGFTKMMIFPSKNKTKDTDPDFIVIIAPKKEETQPGLPASEEIKDEFAF
jgi:hypothetical protein